MTRRRPPYIAQRRQVYIGCEGASEASYAGLLQDFLREANLPVHLVVETLAPGAGDPLARIEMAVRRLSRKRCVLIPL
jgi:3-polyprenyl-4-hydroxybenzoate decarboxylase